MATIVDSANVVNSLESAPDRLRAEIGRYYSTNSNSFASNFVNLRSGIKTDFINDLEGNDGQLIPTKKARIFVSGREDQFRDQIQWNDYVKQTIQTNSPFLDHQFSFESPEIENSLVKNYHDPNYEDQTKTRPSNQLLNYNLISYPFKDEIPKVQSIADIRTTFDDEAYHVNGSLELKELIREFPNRIANYSGSVEEISLKQRNIFDLSLSTYNIRPSMFPFYYSKVLPSLVSNNVPDQFNQILSDYKKRKNIFQSIKQNLSFSNRNFNIGGNQISAKIYNFIMMMTTTRIVSLAEQTDELFLVPETETDYNDVTSRFSDQVNSVRFLSEMRGFVGSQSRSVEEVMTAQPSQTFFLGYKIEKYLDNDAGQPIQTYYTNDRNFYDTQMKYGRKYIYKTKVLIGILGSSYTYSSLFVSQNETQMMAEDGSISERSPAGFPDISNEKYRAYVDVELIPSFQVLEYQVDEDEVAFVDTPTLPPQVEFSNNSKKASIDFFFSPLQVRVESTSGTGEELMRSLVPLTEEDQRISTLVALSKDEGATLDYFTGIYEVYRMSSPPQEEQDFANHFLGSVDDQAGLTFPERMGLRTEVLDNMNGHFEDFMIPNRKYYYAFRALTYHGTPSNLTLPLEVELLRDSDEYKVNVSQYKYPNEKNYMYQKTAKRIIKVVPNIERLLFSEEERTAAGVSYKLDDGNMLTKGQTTKFKIRVTSKHTGKKIDINLNLKLEEDENSFAQNEQET